MPFILKMEFVGKVPVVCGREADRQGSAAGRTPPSRRARLAGRFIRGGRWLGGMGGPALDYPQSVSHPPPWQRLPASVSPSIAASRQVSRSRIAPGVRRVSPAPIWCSPCSCTGTFTGFGHACAVLPCQLLPGLCALSCRSSLENAVYLLRCVTMETFANLLLLLTSQF